VLSWWHLQPDSGTQMPVPDEGEAFLSSAMPSKRKTAASKSTNPDAPTPVPVPNPDLEPVASTAVPVLPHNTHGLPLTNSRGEPLDSALRGPSYWELRRAQWTTPDPAHPPKERQISPGVAKLQRELTDFEICYDNEYFTKNVQGLISQLLSSGRLKVPMPLPIFVRHLSFNRDVF